MTNIKINYTGAAREINPEQFMNQKQLRELEYLREAVRVMDEKMYQRTIKDGDKIITMTDIADEVGVNPQTLQKYRKKVRKQKIY